MNKHPSTALTEEVSLKNDQKGAKAKQIFLGIDAHLKSYEVAIKRDNAIGFATAAMAPEVGFEPTTNRLTADRSTTELLRNRELGGGI
jgi:hypothetical protein